MIFLYIRKKTFVLLITYLLAAVIALGGRTIYLSALSRNLGYTASNGYSHAFSELVSAQRDLAGALHRGAYAEGARMSASVCADVCALSAAAGMRLAELPFSTQELEKTAGFLGKTLSFARESMEESAKSGFDSDTRAAFMKLYSEAKRLSDSLSELESEVDSGNVVFDSPEDSLFYADRDSLVSTAMKKLEDGFEDSEPPADDEEEIDPVSDSEAVKIAAEFFGLDASKLKAEYHSENGNVGIEGDGVFILVGADGNVRSLSSERAVSGDMSSEELETAAKEFLADRGFLNMHLMSSERIGDVQVMSFGRLRGGIRTELGNLRLSLAADDGSVYAYDAGKYLSYSDSEVPAAKLTASQARASVPQELSAKSRGLVLIPHGDGECLCYEFSCTEPDGGKLSIFIDAVTGEQRRIDV